MSKYVEITETPTVTAGAYDAKDAVGGLLTFENAASIYKGWGVIRKLVITNKAGVADLLNLWLYNQTFTASTDNAALDPSDADLLHCLGRISVVAADYEVAADNAVATVLCEFPFVLAENGSSLFGQLECEGTPTYASTTDLQITLTIER